MPDPTACVPLASWIVGSPLETSTFPLRTLNACCGVANAPEAPVARPSLLSLPPGSTKKVNPAGGA